MAIETTSYAAKAPQADTPQSDTAQRISTLALRRFLTEGYSNVPVDALSRELRISKKTLYEHFSSKEALFQYALEQYLESFQTDIERTVQGERAFHSKLERFLQDVHARLGWLEASALEDVSRNAPRVWDYLVTFRRDTVGRTLEVLLEEGKQEGVLRPDLAAPLTVELLLASLEALTRPELLQAHAKSAPEMVAFTVRTVIDGCTK